MRVDLRLYALVDPERSAGWPIVELARRVAEGGVTLVQLRDKRATTRAMVEEARALKAALAPMRVPLIVNDRVDVAFAAGADGVHVGQDDIDPAIARRLLGPDAIVGLSIKKIAQARAAPVEHLDYVAIGGVFATASKENPDPPIGLDGFAAIAAVLRARAPAMPIAAIAGIDESNAGDVVTAGAGGVAVISALSYAPNPTQAAKALRDIVDGALAKRCPP